MKGVKEGTRGEIQYKVLKGLNMKWEEGVKQQVGEKGIKYHVGRRG